MMHILQWTYVATLVVLLTTWPVDPAHAEGAKPALEPPNEQANLPARPLLYFLEHFSLRESAFRYDEDIQALISNPRNAGRVFARLFAKAAFRASRLPNFSADTAFEETRSFISQIGFETIRRGDYAIHLVKMPPPKHPNEAFFVAIVYNESAPLIEGSAASSTRYITLEKTRVEHKAVALGEWSSEGKYTTHGFGDRELAASEFLANLYALIGLKQQSAPDATADSPS
ncbi:MAG: hypothetical protein AAF918_07170 [Pseudomonadota bacterium]